MNITKKSLDNVVKRLQEAVCVEREKLGRGIQNLPEIEEYLIPIAIINQEFETKYSVNYKIYDINNLPLEE
jgi:hypothetical protein